MQIELIEKDYFKEERVNETHSWDAEVTSIA